MAENDVYIAATPEQVFAVLSRPSNYAEWVVGAKDVHDADPGFPAKGSRFEWEAGAGPIALKDETEVLEIEAPRRLLLRVKVSSLGTARIELLLEPEESGTRLTMHEEPETGLVLRSAGAIADPLLTWRNTFALDRLKKLAEKLAPAPGRSPFGAPT